MNLNTFQGRATAPTLADLNGDGSLDVLFGTDAGYLYAADSSGSALALGTYPKILTSKPIIRPVVVAEFDSSSDGPEILLTAGSDLYAYTSTGNLISGFPKTIGTGANIHPPAVSNGYVAVAAGDKVHLFRSTGNVVAGFPIDVGDTVAASPMMVDVNNDSQAEIVVGARTGTSPFFQHQYQAWTLTGAQLTSVQGWPKVAMPTAGTSLLMPAIGEMGGASGLELVGAGATGSTTFRAFNLNSTTAVTGWPVTVTGASTANAAILADVNSDSIAELITTESNQIMVRQSNGQLLPGFSAGSGCSSPSVPAIANLDGIGGPEIITTSQTSATLCAFRANGSIVPGFPHTLPGSMTITAVVIGDVNGDGRLELGFSTWNGSTSTIQIKSLPYTVTNKAPWPTVQRDASRNGAFVP